MSMLTKKRVVKQNNSHWILLLSKNTHLTFQHCTYNFFFFLKHNYLNLKINIKESKFCSKDKVFVI